MVDAIETKLATASFLGGMNPSNEDNAEFVKLAGVAPNVATHPNAGAWFNLMCYFTEAVRSSWGEAVAEAPAGVSKKEKMAGKDNYSSLLQRLKKIHFLT